MNIDLLKSEIEASIKAKQQLLDDEELLDRVLVVSKACFDSLRAGGKIIFCGNGGSFADAQHLSAEFTSRFLIDRPALASIALGTNNSGLTAMSNDYGYENWMSEAIKSYYKANDVVVLTSVSGESPSSVNAAITARELGLKVVTFSGRSSSNSLKSYGDINFWVDSDAYNIVECIHMIWVTTVIDAIVGKAEYEVSS